MDVLNFVAGNMFAAVEKAISAKDAVIGAGTEVGGAIGKVGKFLGREVRHLVKDANKAVRDWGTEKYAKADPATERKQMDARIAAMTQDPNWKGHYGHAGPGGGIDQPPA